VSRRGPDSKDISAVTTRRRFLSVVFPALAAASCSQSGSSADSVRDPAAVPRPPTTTTPPLKLTIQHQPNLCNVGVRVAYERGFFAAEGLDATLLNRDLSGGHDHSVSHLVGPSGPVRADISIIEYPNLPQIASGALDYYVILGEHSGCRQLVVPVRSTIHTVADLKGKRIGIPPSTDPVMWEFLARQAGVDPKALNWVFVPRWIGSSDELAFVQREFASGSLDAYVTGDPVGEILIVDGFARRLASNTWTPPLNGWYCCMWAVRRELLDQHPWLAKALTRAVQQSTQFVERNPAEAVALSVSKGYMPKDTRQDLSARLLGEYVWTGTGRIEADLERYFQLLIEAGKIPASASPQELVKRVYRGVQA
jgi:sulfonate transport system substrate-binding protein